MLSPGGSKIRSGSVTTKTSEVSSRSKRREPTPVDFLTSNMTSYKIVQNQEILCDILFVLEEIVNKALYMCYSNDIKKKTVLFMVRCAYQAMLQLLDLNFYVHDPGRNDFSSDPDWIPDELPAPSPPDTWAAFNVPFVTCEKTETVQESPSKVISQERSTLEMVSVATDYSLPGSLISAEPYGSHSLSDYSECLMGPNVSEELLPESLAEEEESMEDISSEKSLFTKIATLDTDIDTSGLYGDFKRRDTLKLPKLPKICQEIKAKPTEMKVSAFIFPPLRADTILQKNTASSKNEKRKSFSK